MSMAGVCVCLGGTVLAVTGANGSSVIVLLLYQLND